MRVELCRKHSQSPLRLHCIMYLTLLTYREPITKEAKEARPSNLQVVVEPNSLGGSGETMYDRVAIKARKKPQIGNPSNQNFAIKPWNEHQRRIDEDMKDLDKE